MPMSNIYSRPVGKWLSMTDNKRTELSGSVDTEGIDDGHLCFVKLHAVGNVYKLQEAQHLLL